MGRRVESLDYAKGILVILVVIGHIFQDTFASKFIYNFHMMAFFFISGVQFNFSSTIKKPLFQIIKARFYSMIIPLFFFDIWGCVTYLIRYGNNQNINGFIYNTLTLHFNNGVLWFLFTLFFGELVFVMLQKWITNKKTFILISIVCLISALLIPKANNYLDYLSRILSSVFFLSCGYNMYELVKGKSVAAFVISAVVLLLLTGANGCIGYTDATIKNLPLFLLGSFSGIHFVIYLGERTWGKWLRYIGENTLIIFATHNCYYMLLGELIGITDFRHTPLLKEYFCVFW